MLLDNEVACFWLLGVVDLRGVVLAFAVLCSVFVHSALIQWLPRIFQSCVVSLYILGWYNGCLCHCLSSAATAQN